MSTNAVADLTAARESYEETVIGTILDFEAPKGRWLIQRPDGQYFAGYVGRDAERAFTPRAAQAAACQTERGAQHLIDINQGSQAGRTAFRGCKPLCIASLLTSEVAR